MKINESRAAINVETTDVHLPHRIGQAFKGELALRYRRDDCFVRVNWNRE